MEEPGSWRQPILFHFCCYVKIPDKKRPGVFGLQFKVTAHSPRSQDRKVEQLIRPTVKNRENLCFVLSSLSLISVGLKPRKQHQSELVFPHQLTVSHSSDMPTGQPDLNNPSLRLFPDDLSV